RLSVAETNGASVHTARAAGINVASGLVSDRSAKTSSHKGLAPTGGILMKRVTGIGGIFFKAKDPEKLKAWYRTHLGIESESWGGVFHWRDDPRSADAATAWNVFAEETKYFEPSQKPFMINYRVANLQ